MHFYYSDFLYYSTNAGLTVWVLYSFDTVPRLYYIRCSAKPGKTLSFPTNPFNYGFPAPPCSPYSPITSEFYSSMGEFLCLGIIRAFPNYKQGFILINCHYTEFRQKSVESLQKFAINTEIKFEIYPNLWLITVRFEEYFFCFVEREKPPIFPALQFPGRTTL